MNIQLKTDSLTPAVRKIILGKHTESPANKCEILNPNGTYLCRNCGKGLFRSNDKFNSGCGWPSFDNEIDDTISKLIDNDGIRTEITCNACDAHLGHIFYGENFTSKNQRYCVNSLSLDFVENNNATFTEEAIVAEGCFWGVEYYFKNYLGVLKTEVGYIGGEVDNPNYDLVCSQGEQGHVEAVRIVYDPNKITYEQIVKYFFEIHDFSQVNGQGPDIGSQYLSQIFCYPEQFATAQKVIHSLNDMGYFVATTLRKIEIFWPAESYHQNYYTKTKTLPYCHKYVKIFG